MKLTKPKAGEQGDATLKTPDEITSGRISSEAIVALRLQLKQLTTDLAAIAGGRAGSTFAKGDRARLEKRITSIGALLSKLDLDGLKASNTKQSTATNDSDKD